MSKRNLTDTLRDRIRAGGAAHFYDGEEYNGDTLSERDMDTLLLFSDQMNLTTTRTIAT